MKKISLVIIISLIFNSFLMSQYLIQSSLEERAKIAENFETISNIESLGFANNIPSSYSMEKYAVVSKQEGSNCVGFAIAGALNILHNKANNITHFKEKLIQRFDPNFIYCSLKDMNDVKCVSGDGCNCGSHIVDGLELIKNYGCKKLVIKPRLECATTLSKSIHNTLSYMTDLYYIEDWYNFVDWEKNNGKKTGRFRMDIDKMKKLICLDIPLITGVFVGESFNDLNSIYKSPDEIAGAHAITIVGYNDNFNGGSFRVLNSYGDKWGDNGFFWISYKDLIYNFSSSGVYAPLAENLDFSYFSDKSYVVSSVDDYEYFFRGNTTKGNYWEGHMNDENRLSGSGIYKTKKTICIGDFIDGYRDGEWLVLSLENDGFNGFIYYEDGEIVDSERYGFVNKGNAFSRNITIDLDLSENDYDKNILEEIEFTEDQINPEKISSSKKFNYNKKNNYLRK